MLRLHLTLISLRASHSVRLRRMSQWSRFREVSRPLSLSVLTRRHTTFGCDRCFWFWRRVQNCLQYINISAENASTDRKVNIGTSLFAQKSIKIGWESSLCDQKRLGIHVPTAAVVSSEIKVTTWAMEDSLETPSLASKVQSSVVKTLILIILLKNMVPASFTTKLTNCPFIIQHAPKPFESGMLLCIGDPI